jgi:subfamily B ATP-binding cassette protein MsbA
MSWKLSLFSFVAIPLFIILLSKFATKIKSITFKVQKKTADITHISQEVISNIKLVQTYTMEDKEKEKFAKEMKRNFSFNMIIARLRGTMAAILEQAQGIIVLALMFVGGSMIINTTLTGPELLAYFTGVMLLIDPIQALSNVYVSTQEAMASTERMFEILDEKVHISNSPQAITHSIKGKITFDSVGFTYDSRSKNVLNTINLTANEGEIVALVGLSGAGKSTLINLISRLYDPSQGCVRIDDIDIKTMDLGSLRSQIAMVLQEDMMFRGTIGENIRYGSPNAKEKDIIDAAEKANAMEFISTFPKGLHTKVGDKARRLSGGQKQRISIARAILKNPRILILDEATSSLDSHSESLVQEALNRLMKGRTTIVIAHRLSTIEHANTILVLDKGTIIESGSHHELLKRSGHYKHLYELQFAKKSEKHPIKASSDA